VSDKQPPIPGLEPAPGPLLMSYRSRRKATGWPEERVSLERRISALEVELSILKIQLEKEYA